MPAETATSAQILKDSPLPPHIIRQHLVYVSGEKSISEPSLREWSYNIKHKLWVVEMLRWALPCSSFLSFYWDLVFPVSFINSNVAVRKGMGGFYIGSRNTEGSLCNHMPRVINWLGEISYPLNKCLMEHSLPPCHGKLQLAIGTH